MVKSWIPWTSAALLLGLGFVAWRFAEIEARIDRLDARPTGDEARLRALDRELSDLSANVQASIAAVRKLSTSAARSSDVEAQISGLENDLDDASCRIEDQRLAITRFEALADEVAPHAIDDRLAGLGSSIEERCREVDAAAGRALGLAQSARDSADHVARELTRDVDLMWHDMLGPTVQVMGEETVGSGVLLRSEPVPGTEDYATFVLTAWHVVRDLLPADANAPVLAPVTIYTQDGHVVPETGVLVEHDANVDVALLKLETRKRYDCGARLPPRERLSSVHVFDHIYAVGCPLGNDPIPTFGEIADVHHVVDGMSYWMITAPTYIGNSGGGIFDADTHELLGLFTKIYTHGTVRPMVVPHMGLATPLAVVYDWLEHVGYAQLEPKTDGGHARTAAAGR